MSRTNRIAHIAGLSCFAAVLAGTAGVAAAQTSQTAAPTAAPAAACSLQDGVVRGTGFAPHQGYDVTRDGKTIARVSAGPKGDVQTSITGGGSVSVGTVRCASSGSASGSTASDAAAATSKGTEAAQQAERNGASKAQAADRKSVV